MDTEPEGIELPDPMTPAQRAAIKKAWDMLGEHFDRVLLVADFETDKNDDVHVVYWHGGFISAIGLSRYAEHHILRGGSTEQKEPE